MRLPDGHRPDTACGIRSKSPSGKRTPLYDYYHDSRSKASLGNLMMVLK